VDTGGTIYPGLIELHSHLSYNALPLWDVPKKYGNRAQWQGSDDFHRLVSAPRNVIGKLHDYVATLVRYVG
jgi:5-methylthioadenosine/S-adenosylhomocysteine deaminase